MALTVTVTDFGYAYGQWIARPKWPELTNGLRLQHPRPPPPPSVKEEEKGNYVFLRAFGNVRFFPAAKLGGSWLHTRGSHWGRHRCAAWAGRLYLIRAKDNVHLQWLCPGYTLTSLQTAPRWEELLWRLVSQRKWICSTLLLIACAPVYAPRDSTARQTVAKTKSENVICCKILAF